MSNQEVAIFCNSAGKNTVDGNDDITVMDVTAIQYYLCFLKIQFPIGTNIL